MFHLPDGPAQQGRDEMFRQSPTMVPPTWDDRHMDNPPDETWKDLSLASVVKHRIVHFVSIPELPQPVITKTSDSARLTEKPDEILGPVPARWRHLNLRTRNATVQRGKAAHRDGGAAGRQFLNRVDHR